MTRSIAALLVFLACAFGAASTGYFFPPGDWYAGIEKPFFNPPAWIFGPVWTALYVMMSVAAWLMAPYFAWVSFAWLLNLSLWWLN